MALRPRRQQSYRKYALYMVDVCIGVMVELYDADFGETLMFMHVIKQTVTCLLNLTPLLMF
jgi:hypothetical protein